MADMSINAARATQWAKEYSEILEAVRLAALKIAEAKKNSWDRRQLVLFGEDKHDFPIEFEVREHGGALLFCLIIVVDRSDGDYRKYEFPAAIVGDDAALDEYCYRLTDQYQEKQKLLRLLHKHGDDPLIAPVIRKLAAD